MPTSSTMTDDLDNNLNHQPQRVHILDMNASLLSMAAAKASKADDTAVSSLTDIHPCQHTAAETTTIASSIDGAATEVSSVAMLRGWLDDFGKQQKQHYGQQKPNPKQEIPLQTASPPPMPPSQVRQLKGQWNSKPSTAASNHKIVSTTTASTTSIPAHRMVIQHSTPQKMQVQATNDGYASVQQLSAWLASDPTSSSIKARKKILKGKLIQEKSAAFSSDDPTVVATVATVTTSSKNLRRFSVSSSSKPTVHYHPKRMSLLPKTAQATLPLDTWETSSMIDATTRDTGFAAVERAMTEIGSGSAENIGEAASTRAKDMWRQRMTPPRPSQRRHSMSLAAKKQVTTAENPPQGSPLGHASWSDSRNAGSLEEKTSHHQPRLPFNSPAMQKNTIKSHTAPIVESTRALETVTSCDDDDNNIELIPKALDMGSAVMEKNALARRAMRSSSSFQQTSSMFRSQPVDMDDNAKPAKGDDAEVTVKTCSVTVEDSTEASIDPPIIMTSSTLTSLPDMDASYQLTEGDNAAIAETVKVIGADNNGSFKLDMIVPASSRPNHMYGSNANHNSPKTAETTKQHGGSISKIGMQSCPQLPADILDIATLRHKLKPRSETNGKSDGDDTGPVGFRAARATFLAKMNTPSEPKLDEEDVEEEDPDKPLDFRKARALLINRSKKNGNDVEVLNKVTRRKAKFERIIGQEHRRRVSVGSAEERLRRASWQPVDKPGHFEKVYLEADVAAKKTLDELP